MYQTLPFAEAATEEPPQLQWVYDYYADYDADYRYTGSRAGIAQYPDTDYRYEQILWKNICLLPLFSWGVKLPLRYLLNTQKKIRVLEFDIWK